MQWQTVGMPEHACTQTPFYVTGFSGGSEVKVSAWNAGDPSSIPGSGRSPGEERGYHSSILGLTCGSAGKESACNAGDLCSISGLGRSP